MQSSTPSEGGSVPHPDLAEAVARGITLPLAALRASMECLARDLEGAATPPLVLRGALNEVIRMGKNVQALVDFTLPQPLHPFACSLEEIAQATLCALDAPSRARVLLASENGRAPLFVDGPVLSRSLAHLVEAGLAHSSHPVLLRARATFSDAVFSVVCPACVSEVDGEADVVRAWPPNPHLAASTGVGVALARREIERLGGSFATRSSSSAPLLWVARFRIHSSSEVRS
ncbi:MAG: hypothetical protein ACKVWV_18790 [Planctomycetota bacterium]